jgi:phage terminase large subunit-like protein
MITTAGCSTVGVCYKHRDYLCKLLQKVMSDDSYFGVIYTLDEGDNPYD